MTEADELNEKGDDSGARRWLLAELAAIRLWSRRARREHLPQAPLSQGKVPVGATSGWPVTVFVWLISTIDNEGVLLGTEVDLADNELRWGNLAIHHCANGDDVRCERVRTSDARGVSVQHAQSFTTIPARHV